MLTDLYNNDPVFAKEVEKGFMNIVRKNVPGMSDSMYESMVKGAMAGANVKGTGYMVSTALGGNEGLYSKVTEKFTKEGYNAMLDLHDIMDNVSQMPIIGLDKLSLAVTGKEIVEEILKR